MYRYSLLIKGNAGARQVADKLAVRVSGTRVLDFGNGCTTVIIDSRRDLSEALARWYATDRVEEIRPGSLVYWAPVAAEPVSA